MHSNKCSLILLAVLSGVLLNACGSASGPENWPEHNGKLFTLLTAEQTGIDFANNLRENIYNDSNVLTFENYYTGAGVAIGDLDNDGLPEVVMAGNTAECRLYRNKGNLQFEDITEVSGFDTKNFWTNGVTLADVNQDGLLDIYLANGGVSTNRHDRANMLFINQGNLQFSEQGAAYGINDQNRSMHATFFDYDRDGDLDLYVMNHAHYWRMPLKVVLPIMQMKDQVEQVSGNLFRNNGNGSFSKVTEQAGLLRFGYGLGLVVSDLNEDGWPDIYVANDYSIPDFMFINNRNGTFSDRINSQTRQITWFGMGCDIADINNDGHHDIAVVDMATSDHFRGKTLMASMDSKTFWTYVQGLGYQYQYMFNSFQLNNGNGSFSNIAQMAGVAKSEWSWSALLADFDNDGYKDYFVTNGIRRYPRDNDFRIAMDSAREANGGMVPNELRQDLYNRMPQIKLPNLMYRNNGDLTFSQAETDWGTDQPSYSHGAAYGDLDADGDLDLVVNNTDDQAFVYQNNAIRKGGNHFLDIRLQTTSGTIPANAKVTVHVGGEKQLQELTASRGFLSAVDQVLHFGLGDATLVDKLEIEWPGGAYQVVENVKPNRILTVNQPAEQLAAKTPRKFDPVYQQINPDDLGLKYVHYENDYDDFETEILLPHRQSRLGPFAAVGDVNGDGLDDLYVGGAKMQSAVLYTQSLQGRFEIGPSQPWTEDFESEDMDAVFFDADGDSDPDLYVVSGGGGDFAVDDPNLADRLYLNDGRGNFSKATNQLPKLLVSGLRVRPGDWDGDGDQDLFVGGRTTPGRYPMPPQSVMLRNEGGRFVDVTDEMLPAVRQIGMVTDARWTDWNGDQKPDLLVTGEWMAPHFFENTGSGFEDRTEAFGMANRKGWWYSIEAADLDGDGDDDYVLGNIGLNTKFTPKGDKPLDLFCEDFDQNGSLDIVIGKYYKGNPVPLRGRECSSDQMPFIKDKFPTYTAFAQATLPEILGEDNLDGALHLSANEFHSVVIWNEGGGNWDVQPLPNRAQVSAVNRISATDFNNDGNLDLILAGNMYSTEVETPRYDAGVGLVLLGDGKRGFEPVGPFESGIFTPGDVKDFEWVSMAGRPDKALVVTNNAYKLQVFIRNPLSAYLANQ